MASTTATSSWAEYQSRARLFWGVFAVGLIAVLALGVLLLVEHFGLHGLLWPLLAWLAAVVLAGLHWQAFRCPRCEKRFFRRSPPLLALRAQRCVNCMLPKD